MDGACNTQGEMSNSYKILTGKSEVKSPLERIGMDERIILKLIWTGFMWFRIGISGGVLCTRQ
jgi:hypothetical protein